MPVIIPPGMVQNWVEAYALQRYALPLSGAGFLSDVGQPGRSFATLRASFRDKDGPVVPNGDVAQDVLERSIARIVPVYESAMVPPLVMGVVVCAQHIQIGRVSAQLRI